MAVLLLYIQLCGITSGSLSAIERPRLNPVAYAFPKTLDYILLGLVSLLHSSTIENSYLPSTTAVGGFSCLSVL